MPLSNPQALVDRVARKRRRAIWWMVASNAAVALLLVALVNSVLRTSRDSHAAQAATMAETMAAIAQVNFASEMGRVDAVLRATAGEVARLQARGPVDPQAVQESLAAGFALLGGIEALRLTDADGFVRWGNALPAGPPLSVSDREYFALAKTASTERTFVAGPLQSKVSGHWIVVFVRPLAVEGRFNGILYVSVPTEHFRSLLDRYDLGRLDAMTLRRDDLRLVARRAPGSAQQGETGSTQVSGELRTQLASNATVGTYVSRVAVDGVVRTTAYRAVEGWPFTVFAGLDNDRFFAPWKRQAWTVALLAAGSWALVAFATFVVFRAGGREAGAMQALAAQTIRTQSLLRIAGDGIHIVDQEGRLIEMSDSFAEMLRSSRERLRGRPIWSWDVNQDEAKIRAWLAKVRDGDRQRVEVQHRRDDGAIIDVDLNLRVTEIEGRLVVFGSGRDVTEQKRLQREQTAMLESDLVGMVKLDGRIITWRNRAFERLFGYGPGELAGQPVRMLYDDDATYRRVGEEAYPAMQRGDGYRTQARMRRRNGEVIWVDLSGVALSDSLAFFMAVDVTAMREAHRSLSHAAFHDALTQLPNRLLLTDRLAHALAATARDGTRVAVCFMDLDGFKAVNDRLGHDAGDAVLVEVARRLKANIRPTDTAARLGGDEFVLLLTTLTGEEWRVVLDRVTAAMSEPLVLPDGGHADIGVTIGVALSEGPHTPPELLLAQADQRMLAGKRAGKGRVAWTDTA